MTTTNNPHNGVLACGICDTHFQRYEGMRGAGAHGAPYLCKADQDEFDSIDWDEHRERALDGEWA